MLKLFKTWSSLFGLRVVWALNLKGIQYDSVDEDLASKSPSLLQYNPLLKKIPILVHNGKPILESLIIVEYIDESWKLQHPLLPKDPLEKSRACFWAKFNDEQVIPSVYIAFLKGGKGKEEALIPAIENLKFLEEELKGKKFFGGELIGFVDIALGWLTFLVPVIEEILESKLIDEERFPSLFTWMQEFKKVPEIEQTFPPHDKLIAKWIAIRDSAST